MMKRMFALLLTVSLLIALTACGGGDNTETGNELELGLGGDAQQQTQLPNPSATPNANPPSDNPTTPDPTDDGPSPASVTPDYSSTAPATSTPGTPKPELSDAPGTGTPSPKPANYPTSLSDAKKINKDTIGWVKVPNTNISYPILYKYENKIFYYNDHDIFGTKTGNPGAGSIISYYDVPTRNSIIAGHNMRTAGDMFHELHKVQNAGKDLQTRKNRIFEIRLDQIPNVTEWEVFSFYETKENEPESTLMNNIHYLSDKTTEQVQSWIDTQKNRSEVKLDVSVSPKDVFVTLITCGDNYDSPVAQSRLYFFLRGIQKAA